jgi:hypothetical protein
MVALGPGTFEVDLSARCNRTVGYRVVSVNIFGDFDQTSLPSTVSTSEIRR